MGTHKPREPLGETGEYFNAKESRRGSIDDDDDDARRNQDDVEIQPLHPISSNFSTLEELPLSPFHFTHLNSPHPQAHCIAPSPHNFNKPRQTPRRSCCCPTKLSSCCCCCSLCSLCSVLVTAIGVTALLTWLILLRPVHVPQYSLDNVELRNLTVTTTAPDSGPDYSSVNADVVVTITAENLNKRLGFKYDGVGIEILYRGQVFGRSSVGSFALGHRNVTSLTAEVVVKDYMFIPASVGRELSRDAKLARVELRVRASAKVRVTLGVFTSFAVKVFLNCDVVVKPPRGNSPSRVIEKSCKLTR